MSTVALTNDNCLRDSVYHKVKRHIGMNAKSSISYKFPNDQGLSLKFSQKTISMAYESPIRRWNRNYIPQCIRGKKCN